MDANSYRSMCSLGHCGVQKQESFRGCDLQAELFINARWLYQGRPVNVKHDARCVMGKVGGEDKNPKRGGNLIYCYKFAVMVNCL